MLTPKEIAFFKNQGFLIIRGLAEGPRLHKIQTTAQQQFNQLNMPWELESSTGYPGSPDSALAPGGETVRRLLNAFDRDNVWQEWATSSDIVQNLAALMGHPPIHLNLVHHNCLMTKSPQFSSDTHWHQDIRYWSFIEPELVSVWLALGEETKHNGGLSVIPGSHRMTFDSHQLDEKLFLDPQKTINKKLLEQAVDLTLDAGDVLFFHCRLLHSATRNNTDRTKFSLVFTYHNNTNKPLPASRSDGRPEIKITL